MTFLIRIFLLVVVKQIFIPLIDWMLFIVLLLEILILCEISDTLLKVFSFNIFKSLLFFFSFFILIIRFFLFLLLLILLSFDFPK